MTKVKKLAPGTYRVSFSKTQTYDVIIPNFWVELGDEKQCREVAIEAASEQLECIDD